jgi:archaellum component FlaC
MDQELISYLDKRFDEMGKRFDAMDARFDAVEQRLDKVEQRLDLVEAEVKGLKKETYETRILMEHLQDKVQLVAEGLAGVVASFKVHRAEVSEEIRGIKGLIQQSYSDLDRRVRNLEARSA